MVIHAGQGLLRCLLGAESKHFSSGRLASVRRQGQEIAPIQAGASA